MVTRREMISYRLRLAVTNVIINHCIFTGLLFAYKNFLQPMCVANYGMLSSIDTLCVHKGTNYSCPWSLSVLSPGT